MNNLIWLIASLYAMGSLWFLIWTLLATNNSDRIEGVKYIVAWPLMLAGRWVVSRYLLWRGDRV